MHQCFDVTFIHLLKPYFLLLFVDTGKLSDLIQIGAESSVNSEQP